MRLIKLSFICLPVALAACLKDVKQDDPVEESAATIAVFAPDSANPCNSVIPFPNDLAKDPMSERLNVPFCEDDTDTETAVKTGLRTLDGFSLQTPIYATFSRALDADSIVAGTTYLLDMSTTPPTPVAHAAAFNAASSRLFIVPGAPLEEATTYMVVVSDDLEGEDGSSVESDQIFTFAKSEQPLIDGNRHSTVVALSDAEANALEELRQGYADMFDGIEAGLGLSRDEVAIAWTFTTQSIRPQLLQMANAAVGLGATVSHESVIAAAEHPLIAAAGIPATNLCNVHSGTITLRNFVTFGGTLDPAGPTTTTADYILITPNQGDCAASWDYSKTVVYAHALGRCKNDALALADTLASGLPGAGDEFAVLALDGPRAGGRMVGNLGDQDLDGCPDQPATPELITLSGSPNPFAVRDQLRQWAMEIAQAAQIANDSPWLLVGDAAPVTPPATEVNLFGHSFGGIATTLAGSVSPLTVSTRQLDIEGFAVNAASAELGAVFTPSIQAAIAAEGIDPTSAEGQARLAETVSTFRWVLEPADPLYHAGHATEAGLAQVVTSDGEMADAPLHDDATQTNLALALHPAAEAATRFEMTWDAGGGDIQPICDDPTATVGAILQPCAEAMPELAQAVAKLTAMRTQLLKFFVANCGGTETACP